MRGQIRTYTARHAAARTAGNLPETPCVRTVMCVRLFAFVATRCVITCIWVYTGSTQYPVPEEAREERWRASGERREVVRDREGDGGVVFVLLFPRRPWAGGHLSLL